MSYHSIMSDQSVSLIAIANPVLDMCVKLRDTQILDKYKLKTDSSNSVSKEVWNSLIQIIKNEYKISYSPGGCALNTVRIFQWLEKQKFQTVLAGSTADDENGKLLENQLQEEGVRTELAVVDNANTSVSLLLTHTHSRTIVFLLDNHRAGLLFSTASPTYFDRLFSTLEKTKFLLTDAYVTYHCADLCQKAFAKCNELDITTVFSIVSESMFHLSDPNQTIIPFVENSRILVGNRREFELLCRHLMVDSSDLCTALKQIYSYTSVNLKKTRNWPHFEKIILITDDKNPVHCYTGQEYIRFPVPPIDESRIEDTIGAGDAFLGGFLYAFSKQKPFKACLEIACRTAAEIIHQQGCTLPQTSPDFAE